MGRNGKLLVLAVVAVATIAVITSGTMALYSQYIGLTAELETAGFVIKVNESESQSQVLADMTILPGQSFTRQVKINTSGCDTPTRLTVTLAATPSGALPEGFSITLDGVPAAGAGTLTAERTIDGAEDQVFLMAVTVAWEDVAEGDLSRYEGVSVAYEVVVEAWQTEG